jgi:hypothetical protein
VLGLERDWSLIAELQFDSRAPLRGRPRPRNAIGPPTRTLSRQAYNSRSRSFKSRATSAIFSPAATRATAARFNAIGTPGASASVPLLEKLSPIFRVSLLGSTTG